MGIGQRFGAVPPSAGGVLLSKDLKKDEKVDEEPKIHLAIEFHTCTTLHVGAFAPGTRASSC